MRQAAALLCGAALCANGFPSEPCVAGDQLFDADGRPLHTSPADITLEAWPLRATLLGDFGVDEKKNLPPGEWRDDYDVELRNQIAARMKEVTREWKADMAINVGDSFYADGLQTTNDSRWKTTWGDVFTHPAETYWYSILGNHDWDGNEKYHDDSGVTSQIAYTGADPENRWCMPDMNYTFSAKGADGAEVRFVFLDTQSMLPSCAGGCRDPLNYSVISHDQPHCAGSVIYSAADQLAWLKDNVCRKGARGGTGPLRTVVVGHHPLVSAGPRMRGGWKALTDEWVAAWLKRFPDNATAEAAAEEMRQNFVFVAEDPAKCKGAGEDLAGKMLLPIFEECGVDLYISGHEHMTQLARYEYTAKAHGTSHLHMLLFGDSGKNNTVALLETEPTKTACAVTGLCLPTPDRFAEVWGAGWELLHTSTGGAFGALEVRPDGFLVRALGVVGEKARVAFEFGTGAGDAAPGEAGPQDPLSDAPLDNDNKDDDGLPAVVIVLLGVAAGLLLIVAYVCITKAHRTPGSHKQLHDGNDEMMAL